MLTIADMFPEAPTEIHFSLTCPAASVENTESYATFHSCAISASLLGFRVSVDDFNPDGSASMVATGKTTMGEALDFGALLSVRAETHGFAFSPIMVVEI